MSPDLAASLRRHSLGWLAAANAVGVLLAALLLWPDLNGALAPLTYGRWVPLHLDWQLYGWCALPLVGVLLGYFMRPDAAGLTAGRAALGCWSLGLAFGGASWLAGWSSGKIFLEWAGPARVGWSLALLCLWLLLCAQAWPRRREFPLWAHLFLAALFAVPFVLWWASDPRVYPAVDPDTGGATGASLLGSTLGLLAVFGLLPWLLRLPVRAPAAAIFRRQRLYWLYFAFSFALDLALRHGNVSHHDHGHIIGLGSLIAWVPLVWRYTRSFAWPPAAPAWLGAAFAWWLLLAVTGFGTYLPAIADRLKFTNGLVAHAHLAMAGLVTSLHVAILLCLDGRWRPARWSGWLWQAGCAVQVGLLLWLGWQEGADPSVLYVRGGLADLCYAGRLAAGLAMLAASIAWCRQAWRTE
ncbi:MAG: hypothetical protein JNG83_11820 [Opitutaceae bacterium]|nr:hypothetical protein [Opitutaceae bacterium]